MYPRGENKKKEESEMGFLSNFEKIKHRVVDFIFDLIHTADIKGRELSSEKLAPWALASDVAQIIKGVNPLNGVFVQSPRWFKNPTILLVIDDSINKEKFYRSLLKEFSRHGWQLTSAAQSGDWLKAANENREYDIFVCDMEDLPVQKVRLGETYQVMEIF